MYLKTLQANSRDKCYSDKSPSRVDLQLRNTWKKEGKEEDEVGVETLDRIWSHSISKGKHDWMFTGKYKVSLAEGVFKLINCKQHITTSL